MSSANRARRNGAAVLTATALLATGMVGGAAPATADGPGGTVTVTSQCNPDGSMSPDLSWTESFSGLVHGGIGAAYQAHILIQGTTTQWGGEDGTTYWYADSSGDHTASGAFKVTPSDVQAGDAVTWSLDHVSGGPTEVASGSGAVTGPSCSSKPPPPDKPGKPSFASTPSSVHVAKSGKFAVRFTATPKATGRVTITKKTLTLAAGRFTVPANGKVSSKLTLGKKKLKALKHKGHEAVKITVTVKNAGGSATSHTTTVLKAPKH